MAPTRGPLKGIYPERKKGSSSKSSAKQKSKKGKSSQRKCQGDADSGGYTAEEEELRQFDMDMSYGPCVGVTRLRRWERAAAMGLRPPPHLRDLILRQQQQHHGVVVVGVASSPPPKSKSESDGGRNGDIVVSQIECLWAGKVCSSWRGGDGSNRSTSRPPL